MVIILIYINQFFFQDLNCLIYALNILFPIHNEKHIFGISLFLKFSIILFKKLTYLNYFSLIH